MRVTHSILLTLATAAPALAQADDCVNATDLGSGTVIIDFDLGSAVDTGAPATDSPIQGCSTANPGDVSIGNDVWFRWTPTAWGTVEISTCDLNFNSEIAAWRGSDCANLTRLLCDDDSGACGSDTSRLEIAVAPGTTYHFQVGTRVSFGAFSTGTGTFTVRERPGVGTCAGAPDFLEPNNGCANATPLGYGTYPGLNVEELDNDYYAVTVADGETLAVEIEFDTSDGDIDLFLWDPLTACDTNAPGGWQFSDVLASGFTATDDETLVYTNDTGAAQDLIIEVDMFMRAMCNEYTLKIGPRLGTPFCESATPNGTGAIGTLDAWGSTSVAANDVEFRARNVSPFSYGVFLASLTQTPPTPVANGVLCLDLAIGQYHHVGEVWVANGLDLVRQIDLQSIPSEAGSVAVVAGESWSFQAWHRDFDDAGRTANFTTGVQITFVP
ncbi:MAG: hypothetical protein AAFU73_22570 [Planctomycetota bacterium]